MAGRQSVCGLAAAPVWQTRRSAAEAEGLGGQARHCCIPPPVHPGERLRRRVRLAAALLEGSRGHDVPSNGKPVRPPTCRT